MNAHRNWLRMLTGTGWILTGTDYESSPALTINMYKHWLWILTGTDYEYSQALTMNTHRHWLWILTLLETFANKTRNDGSIKGIKIDKKEIKLCLLADDRTLILHDLDSVKNTNDLLKKFSFSAGLKINIDKTQAKYIGTLSSCNYYPHGLSWIKTHLETLGITICDNGEISYKHNFQQRISNLKSTLNIWKDRKLSLMGKVAVLNNLDLAPLIYVSGKAINEISNIIL